MTKPVQVVGAIIENEKGEVLLAERPPGKHLAGLWEFPGGKIEPGEQPTEALIRELQEELELDVRIGKYLGSFPHKYSAGEIELHIYQVQALSEPVATEAVRAFRWVEARAISHAELAPADILPLQSYLALRPMH